jgi:hypothetical protein
MKRHVLVYELIGGVLITVLKWTEYRFLVIEHSLQIYGGLTAATFAVLGIWLGLKLARHRRNPCHHPGAIAGAEKIPRPIRKPALQLRRDIP